MSERYDAVGIEYAFARIVGNEIGARGTECDADIFRAGKEFGVRSKTNLLAWYRDAYSLNTQCRYEPLYL